MVSTNYAEINYYKDNTEDIKTIRAAAYVRVSTEEQAELGYSIDAQLDNVQKFCRQKGHIMVEEYADRGVSGKSIDGRFALQQLIADAKQNKFDIVYVWKISRLARKNVDLLTIVEELNKHNVKLYSISENFDTETTMGKFSLQMMGAVAEFERNTILENVKLGMRQRARKGQWNGGSVIGYKSTKGERLASDKEISTLVVVPEEAVVVRKIFNLYASGKGLKAIANQLNHEGYRTKRKNMFGTASIKEIILNPVYVGKIRFNRYENWSEKRRKGKSEDVIIVKGHHEAIINENLWNKVQFIQQKKSKTNIKNYEGKYLLVGFMKCPKCGAAMVSSRTTNKLKDGTKKVLRYYSCGAFRSKGSAVCQSNSIRADYAEQYVIKRLQYVVNHPSVLEKIIERTNQKKRDNIIPLQEELQSIKPLIVEVERTRDKYLKLYENNMIDQDMIIERLNKIREERDNLLKRKATIEKELSSGNSQTLNADYLRKLFKEWHRLLEIASFDQKKMLLQLIVQEIKINEEKKIESIFLLLNNELQSEILQEALSDQEADRVFAIYLVL